MIPPRLTLSWEEVVEYAFLADFDLLREGRGDICGELWAQPAGQAAMDQHFKLLHADKEIAWLNVEVRRLVTFMVDEEAFLTRKEECLGDEGNTELVHQVGLVHMECTCFTELHMSQLVKLSKEVGFTSDILPGTSVSHEHHAPVNRDRDVEMSAPSLHPFEEPGAPPRDDEEDHEGSDEDKDKDSTLAKAFMNIVRIAGDDGVDPTDK